LILSSPLTEIVSS
jgi:chromosome segregation ATPase